MPIDPSIALQVQPVKFNDPVEMYGKMQTLQHLQQQNELMGLQQQQLRDTMAENQGIKAVFGDEKLRVLDPESGITNLNPEGMRRAMAISPERAFKFQQSVDEQKQRYVQMRAERSKEAKEQLEIRLHQHNAQVEAATGLLHVFHDHLKALGGDPNNPDATPELAAKAEAMVEQQLRPGVRQQLIEQKLIDPNTPDMPFTWKAYSAMVMQKEKIRDMLKAQAEQKAAGVEFKVGANNNYVALSKDPRVPPRDTGVRAQEHFSTTPVPVLDEDKNPAGAVAIGDQSTVIPIPVNPAPKGNQGKLSVSEQQASMQWKMMDHSHKSLDALSKDVPRMPYSASMYSNEGGALSEWKNWIVRNVQSPKEQMAFNAAREFIMATGYRLSQSQVRPGEFRDFWNTYIPLQGDDNATVASKRAARINLLKATRVTAGGGAQMLEDAERKELERAQGILGIRPGSPVAPGAPGESGAPSKRLKWSNDKDGPVVVPNQGGASGSWGQPPAPAAPAPAAPPAAPAQAAAPAGDLPQEAVPALREGFARDVKVRGEWQTWTLRDGKPFRLK